MVHCISDTCREELDQKWNFCPFCGVDNRPPEYRPKIKNCRHEYVKADGFCVDCGRKYGSGSGPDLNVWQTRLGLLAASLGSVLLVAAFLIWRVHLQGHGPGYDWIRSWFDDTYQARGRHGYTYMRQRGADVLSWMSAIGFVLIFGGLSAMFPKLNTRSRFDT
jgi:hypothetical protein